MSTINWNVDKKWASLDFVVNMTTADGTFVGGFGPFVQGSGPGKANNDKPDAPKIAVRSAYDSAAGKIFGVDTDARYDEKAGKWVTRNAAGAAELLPYRKIGAVRVYKTQSGFAHLGGLISDAVDQLTGYDPKALPEWAKTLRPAAKAAGESLSISVADL